MCITHRNIVWLKYLESELESTYQAIEEVQSYLDAKLYIKFQSRDLTQNFIWIEKDPHVIYQTYGIGKMSLYNNWVIQGPLNESFSPRNYPYISISERTLSYHFYKNIGAQYSGPYYVTFSNTDIHLPNIKEYIYSSIKNTYIWGVTFFTRAVITDIKFVNRETASEFDLLNSYDRVDKLIKILQALKRQKAKLESQQL